MKTLMLVLSIFGTSIGFANAHRAKHHLSHESWQAAAAAPKKTSQSCSAAQGQQARINACGEYVPSIYDPSPGSDY
jgi:hypothetical protein